MTMDSPSCCPARAWKWLAACLLPGALTAQTLTLTDADVCVYGGTSGGVAAAVQAARLGQRVVIIEPGRHLGGMSSSGLGVTDIGPHGREYIGGISREFYRRVGAKYGRAEEVWFEPKVAEQVFNELAAEAGVTVVFGESLAGVEKAGPSLTRLLTTTGRMVRARQFIDATYEGDLLAAAGASWLIGREPNAQFSESFNGVRATTPLISGRRLDPYQVPGDPASGLIPLVRPGPAGPVGSGDSLLQAYNYRLCLTNVPANRVPIDPPADYDPARYELLARYILSGPAPGKPAARPEPWVLDDLIDVQTLIPNGKTDINAGSPISTDFHRGNDGYVTATPEGRAVIARAHENYIRGLLHFLRTDPRVPENVREEMASWGLARDEFTDNGHWPRQLYVREARRLSGSFVMTDRHGRGLETAPDAIGLAAYWLDSHSFQLLDIGGEVRHEGGFFTSSPLYPPKPFPIAFQSLVPRRSEVDNLSAPFCLSATHACFASLRMEPVFMITSQAAAAAAALAIEADSAIQDVPYPHLRTLLEAEGQVLSLASPPPQPDGSIVVDTENSAAVSITGSWGASTSVAGFQGSGYLTDGNAGQGAKSIVFRPVIPEAGSYRVAVAYRAFSNRASNVPMALTHAGGTATWTLDQRLDAGPWKELGIFDCAAGPSTTLTVSNTGTNGFVIADAARWTPTVPPPPAPIPVSVLAANPRTTEGETGGARIVFSRAYRATSPLVLAYTVDGRASPGLDYPALSGTVTIPPQAVSVSVPVRALADAQTEGPETLIVTLIPSAAVGAAPGFENATLTLLDPPYDSWRSESFPPANISDDLAAGPHADPDGDGSVNAVEWALASSPTESNTSSIHIETSGQNLILSALRLRSFPLEALAWEMSADAQSWHSPVPAPVLTAIDELSPTTDRLHWRWPIDATSAAPTFFRLRVKW